MDKYGTVKRIAEHIEAQIVSGRFVKGDKIQSIRSLANELEVSPSSVYSAVTMLIGKGVLISTPRNGYFVTKTPESGGRSASAEES